MIFNLLYINSSSSGGESGGDTPQGELTINDFDYSGKHRFFNDGGGNWRIEIYHSGTFTLKNGKKNIPIDIFCCGGGGGGASGSDWTNSSPGHGGHGGGGGQCTNVFNRNTGEITSFSVKIGAGGNAQQNGQETKFGTLASAAGGSWGGGNGGAGGTSHTDQDGEAGGLGSYPFDDTTYGKRCGAGGSGGHGQNTGSQGKSYAGNGGYGGKFSWYSHSNGGPGTKGIIILRNHRP